MKRSAYDEDRLVGWKNGTYPELLRIFADCEGRNSILERIEVNASTLIAFRMLGSEVEQATLRDCKKGLFARVLTAEIWLNNDLKDGQLKIMATKTTDSDPDKIKRESKLHTVTNLDDAREWFLEHKSGSVRCEAGGYSIAAASFTEAKLFFTSQPG